MEGTFITFEGGDGAGKSTHIAFLADALRSQGREVLCLREPGGTLIGEALRGIVLDPSHGAMTPEAELFIYEAARAQIVSEVIKPALEAGKVVLCDRFYDSTVAYQAYGRGLSLDFVRSANAFACQGIRPHRTVLLRAASSADSLHRATRAQGADRMEQAGLDFHERVNQAFEGLNQVDPQRVRVVESSGPKSETARAVFRAVADCVGWDPDNLPFSEDFFQQANKRRKRVESGARS